MLEKTGQASHLYYHPDFQKSLLFDGDPTILRSISTGLVAARESNVDTAKEIAIGMKIAESITFMTG